jgi:hypothetical protein
VRFNQGTPTLATGVSADVLFLTSCNFTCSSSTRHSRPFRDRAAPLILLHGIVKWGSPFFKLPSYVEMRKSFWWTPVGRRGSFPSSHYNSGAIFVALHHTAHYLPGAGRPASLQLPIVPSAIFSSPDGSCLIVLHTRDLAPLLTAYHWETFGSTAGIPLDAPDFPLQNAVLTSMINRGRIFLVGLDRDAGSIRSIAIDITKVTELVSKKEGSRNVSHEGERHSLHNSLLDCHAEVWTRYPVLAAVRRRTVTSLSEREQKSLTFITKDNTRPFKSYFSDLIRTFEGTTKKPGGDELRRIKVSAARVGLFLDKTVLQSDWKVSRYRVGEWLVDLFCLIPIHIAVCRENRFVPLVDGVISSDPERSLLGAEVNKIIDKLSFGWYESIFRSYLATKV